MAKAQWSVNNFLSEVSSRGLAKPARFEVVIDVPPCIVGTNVAPMAKTVGMFCDQASLPYTRVITSRQQIYGPPSIHPVGVEYNGENLSLQFYVDREMRVKRFFDLWVDGIIDRTEHSASYQSNYLTNILVRQLDEADNINYAVKLWDIYPTAVQALQLDNTAANQTHKLTVSFAFRKWTEVTVFDQPAPEITKSTPRPNLQIRNGSVEYNIAPNFRTGAGAGYDVSGVGGYDTYFIVK